jgi:hypothetical protein
MQGMMPQQEEQYGPMAPGDEMLYVQFYMGSMKNEEKSVEQGRPIFESVPFVKILVPGDRNTVVNTIVDNKTKRRFAKLWHQFEQNNQQTIEGLPIREWPAITRAQADELFYLNIVTVEQLASLADVYGTRIMGFQDLKRKAQTYLAAAKDTAIAEKLSSENAALKQQVATLEDQIKLVNARFEKLEAAQKA